MRRQRDTQTLDLFAWSAERNLPTPPPHAFRLLDPTLVEWRPFMDVVERAWATGENLGIVADTSTGKTLMAFVRADVVLDRGQRVVFSAPTNPLCAQHAESAQKYFRIAANEVSLVRARGSAKRRAAAWASGRLTFSTPQTLANDLAKGVPVFDGVGLLVIDEAHHAAHRHATIAVAHAAHAQGIRILALTASPGGDTERIERIRKNLMLARWVRISEEMTGAFRPPISVERIAVTLPDAIAPVLANLERILDRLCGTLADRGYLEPPNGVPSPKDLAAAIANIRKNNAHELLPQATAGLQILTILTYAASDDYGAAYAKLEDAMTRTRNGTLTRTARRLRVTPEVIAACTVLRTLRDTDVRHPKEVRLLDLIQETIAHRSDARILVYHRFADGARRLAERITATCGVRAECILGRARMRPDRVHAIIAEFRDDAFPILVATDVVREGIHIPAIHTLIAYMPPRNELELIQLFGRVGRTETGNIFVLTATHSIDTRYTFSAPAKAQRMREILRHAAPSAVIAHTSGVTHRSAFAHRRRKTPADFIAQLQPGLVFERFTIRDAYVVHQRRPYVRFLVGDRTGMIPLVHWCPRGRPQADALLRAFPPQTVAIIAGVYTADGYSPRIIVDPRKDHRLVTCPESDFDPADYAPEPMPF